MDRKVRLSVVGPSHAGESALALAEEVGSEIAGEGAVLVCGGLGGVMEAAARGAKRKGGLTVGILPTGDCASANPFIDIPIATGLGEARNVMVVRSSDAVIAIAGGYGTLSEIAFALRLGIPVVGLGTWRLCAPEGNTPPIIEADSPRDAVQKALLAIRK